MRDNMIKVLIGIGIAFAFTFVLLFIFSMILAYTNVSESTIIPVVIAITGISILIGSSISTSRIKKKGIVNGMIVGGIYVLTIYLLSSILSTGFNMNTYSIVMIIIGILCGGVGGIVGVNLK